MEFLSLSGIGDPHTWLSLLVLAALEIVLGIDNLLFIAVLTDRLPEEQRPRAQRAGLAFALFTRIVLLTAIAWIVTLTEPLFSLFAREISWRSLILISGGLFLIVKATGEIHDAVEGDPGRKRSPRGKGTSFVAVVVQIGLIDVVFSLDSVVTAVGMVDELWVMVTAIVVAIGVMMIASAPLAKFVVQYPTIKMLALSFLLVIGIFLIADGLGFRIPKGYLYFSLAFSVMVETLNHWMRRRRKRARA